MVTRNQFLSLFATGAAAATFPGKSLIAGPPGQAIYSVIDFGAAGDGRTPSADAFQQALDEAEQNGGGIVFIPAGRFVLEKTPLIGSNVQLTGSGPGSVLVGERPGGSHGAALISNKGQQASGYGGAANWAICNIAIDSPKTNGIVVTHAQNVYLSYIYGIHAYNHFIDTAGKNIICENLFLTGPSGTSTFQIDSLGNAQTIWDGRQAVSPNLDGTDTKDLILRNSIITAVAGHEGRGPQHRTSIHFHGEVSSGFLFSDLIIGGAENGFYMDNGSSYSDIQMTNVTSYNPGRSIWFEPSTIKQENVSVRGLIHKPEHPSKILEGYRAISIYGTDHLTLSDINLIAPSGSPCLEAIELDACEKVDINNVKAVAENGTALLIRDRRDSENTISRYMNVHNCMLEGFQTGMEYRDNNNGGNDIRQWRNLFIDIPQPVKGNRLQSEV